MFELFIVSIIFIVGLTVALVFFNRRFQELVQGQRDDKSSLMLQNQINELSRVVDNKLAETHRVVREQYGMSAKIIQDVTEKLTKLDETNRQVVDFADQLQDLQDILKNPKQRGILGEYLLETVLKNVLPPGSYEMQHAFKDGEIVDAAIFIKDKIIPVDSKFSLENYNRLAEEKNETERARLEKVFVNDLKQRIVETSKYIRPSEGTMDFAFMFIPHEAIYYDLLINKIGALQDEDTNNLIQRAASKYKVIIISPTSFLAYLQTVMQGLRALQIEESVKDITKKIGDLGKHLAAYDSYMKKLGNSLTTSVSMYNSAYKEFQKIDKDVVKISDGEKQIEPMQLEKPDMGE